MFPGLKVLEAVHGKLSSGINCVYFDVINEDGVVARFKIYNKGVETIQQGGCVRSKDVSDKSAYLLSPSTTRLTDVFHDPSYFNHGVTRIEFTIERMSSVRAVKRLVKKYTAILSAPGALVSCSMHEMIESMGKFVGRSVAVYYPQISEAKAAMWADRANIEVSESEDLQMRHSDFRKQLIDTPEAFFTRYHNSRTGKVNGLSIRGHFATRSCRSKSALAMMVEALGWASSCKNDPLLFICVAGDTEGGEGGVSGGGDMSHMYFRKVHMTRTGGSLVTCLPWHCDFQSGGHKNHTTDWERIGVQVNKQENLRFVVHGRGVVPTFESMGRIDVEVSGVPDGTDDLSVAGSEERAAVTGIECMTYKLEDHNGALSAWVAWSDYKICLVGKSSTEKLRFKVCGDWFWVPVGVLGRQLIEHLKGLDLGVHKAVCEVCMDEGDIFHWRPSGDSGVGRGKVIGKCNAAKALPVKETPYAILGAGLEWTGRINSLYLWVEEGRFYAPQSIRDQVLDQVNEKGRGGGERVSEFLAGKLIKHTASCFKKPRGAANSEELFAIVDDSGAVVASNIYDGRKRQRR
jgi:hypothetical protein